MNYQKSLWTILVTAFLLLAGLIALVAAQPAPPASTPSAVAQEQAAAAPTSPSGPDILQLQADIRQLQSEITAQGKAQEAIRWYVQIVAAVFSVLASLVAVAGVTGLVFQGIAFRVEARLRLQHQNEATQARAQFQEENAKQTAKENALNERFIRFLQVASDVAEQAQKKVTALEEGELNKANVTLTLINSLLEVTARTAIRASETEYNIIQREIANKDEECRALIAESLREEERSIIANPKFRNQVMTISKDIDGLTTEIRSYNRSQSSNFVGGGEVQRLTLALTAPCLFVRGQEFNVEQNFPEAIKYWMDSLTAAGHEVVTVDANYWIAYTKNTLGQFTEALGYLNRALEGNPGDRKPELSRLQLETQFFAMGLQAIPDRMIVDGGSVFRTFAGIQLSQEAYQRALSSFATTMGNMRLIRWVRIVTAGGQDPSGLDEASSWLDQAITAAEGHARWATFAKCQAHLLKGNTIDDQVMKDVAYIRKSVNDEYNRRDRQPRSQLLCKATEYYCVRMLGDNADEGARNDLPGIAQEVQRLGAGLEERFIYSQFRKQNVGRETFFKEFDYFKRFGDMVATMKFANSPP